MTSMSAAREREAFVQHARAFVDERVDRALDDLLVGERAPRMPAAARSRSMSAITSGSGIGLRSLAVAVPALAASSARSGPSRTACRRRAACARPAR